MSDLHPCACRFNGISGQPVRYCAHHATRRDEIERLTAERDTAEANLERLQSKFEAVTAENAELQTRVKELEAEVRTHFEHGWNRGFHAGSAQVNTLPSDWSGYRAIIEQGEKDE